MNFKNLSEQWLEVKKLDIGASQLCAYNCYLKHLQPLFDMDVDEIRLSDIQAVIAALAVKNPHTGKPTAKKTLRDVKHTAKQILQYGIDMQIISYNAAQSVKIPRNAPKETRRALTPEERQIINNTTHRMQICGMIMLYAGLRRGELIPLEWRDIDLNKGTITVNKAVEVVYNDPVVKETKTDAGMRVVNIPSVLIQYLASIPHTGDYIITQKRSDKMMTASSWRKGWISYQKATGLYDVTPHMLRHTACTMMIESGMDVSTVQRQMGHADVQTTLDVYTHVTQKHRAAEVEKLDLYLEKAAG